LPAYNGSIGLSFPSTEFGFSLTSSTTYPLRPEALFSALAPRPELTKRELIAIPTEAIEPIDGDDERIANMM
jgi:hypothetical protein